MTRVTSFFFFFCLIIPYKYYQKCCYACFCERGRASVRFHLCMNSNHSAGGGRSGWTGVFTEQEEKERKKRGCYVMRGDRSDEESQRRSGGESQCGEGRSKWPAVALWKPIRSASIIWVIAALCLCGRRGNHQPYQMRKV